MQAPVTVLIVEDELIPAEYLRETLEKAEYTVLDIVSTGKEAIEAVRQQKPDVVLMDIMLEDNISGSEAALQIHRNNPECKIIFLTAYADDEMIEYADRSEAYGYLLKPYRDKEILATIRLAFSRQHDKIDSKKQFPEVITLTHGFSFNTKVHRLCKNNQEVKLSKKALRLVELLVRNKNTSVSNEQIFHHVWGEIKSENTLRSLIHRIRCSVDENLIQNINGIGYMIRTSG